MPSSDQEGNEESVFIPRNINSEKYHVRLTHIVDPPPSTWSIVLMIAFQWAGIVLWNALLPSAISAMFFGFMIAFTVYAGFRLVFDV